MRLFIALCFSMVSHFLISQPLAYQCPPCDAACDGLTFAGPGNCPQCGMTLQVNNVLEPPTVQTAEDSWLERIREESRRGSEIEKLLYYFTDVLGPRLMGSTNYYQAAWYANSTLIGWDLNRVAFEKFDDGHRGWELRGHSLELLSPFYERLAAVPRAFTSSTNGTIEAEVVFIPHTDQLEQWRGKLQGKVVLLGDNYRADREPPDFSARTLTSSGLAAAVANRDPNNRLLGYHSRRSTLEAIEGKEQHKKAQEKLHRFLIGEGAAGILEPSSFSGGILHVDGWGQTPVYTKKGELTPLPAFVISHEACGRLQRLSDQGVAVLVRLNLEAEFTEAPRHNVNVVAELTGSDPKLKDELVVIGAHLDSWHAGAGATDNAASCAVMMEAMRLLRSVEAQPRRTIRLVLWGGHEQNFEGSRKYISSRVGALDGSRYEVEHQRTSVYFNLDNGAGRIRGFYLMGNDRIEPFFQRYLEPFPESRTLTLQSANQSDHELFDWMGIPAFQFIQDPLNYIPVTHHTNLDQPEYVDLADQQYNAELVAYLALQAANEDQRLPRKPFHSPTPILDGRVTIRLDGFLDAKAVSVVGTFNNWVMHDTKLQKMAGGWECRIDLPPGRHLYKFIVDGQWTADPRAEQLFEDGAGHAGLAELVVE